ncbi:MAG: LacI family DNA-binding transcriptional regulator [Lachnospiraceae bacterium]|nr:LacI family DNA-binding transcriptional regulator [Lachnospiraceae bacterium]
MDTSVQKNKITIVDVADALGISKTTVSRAISGKGRIGEETRQRVLDYIKENDYKPSPLAKGLAKSRTYNLCFAIPDDSTATDAPFFLRCMLGVAKEAAPVDYDILNVLMHERDISQLKRVVENRKVDGVILGRTLMKDSRVRFLKESGIPFVVIGSTQEKNVVQIDNDHIRACRELTKALLKKDVKKIALIGGDMAHVVNQTRKRGFEEGVKGLKAEDVLYYQDREEREEIYEAVMDAVEKEAECIVSTDDHICYNVLQKLHSENISIPQKIKVASFYDSQIIANHHPEITALQYDPKELGMIACRTLLKLISGEEVQNKVLLGYELRLTDSV